MSTVKFSYPTYKLFEPQYHPQRPIIIDADAIESPETVTLRYEEEAAARANGGGLRGDSPPGLLDIEACQKSQPPQMHSFDSPRPYQDAQYQYAAQPYGTQQTENAAAAAAQLNHLAFAANNSAAPYMTSVVPTVNSYRPTSGVFGTKVLVKISSPFDFSRCFLAFGSHKSPAHAIRDSGDASGYGYVVSGDAPHLDDTRIHSGNVPISLLIEGADGQTLANVEVGTFTYHDTQAAGAEGSHENITRRLSSKSPEEEQQRTSPPKQQQQQQQEADQLVEATATATNTYGYAPATHQAVASNYDAAGYPSNNHNSMLSTYHRSTYGADYPRPPPSLLKAPTWASSYGHSLAAARSPPGINTTTLSRPSVTALPIPTSNTPILTRTSTIQANGSSSGGMNPYALYSTKAVLKINGDLESMANNWTNEECENGRRLVLFHKKQQGSTLSMSFKPVSISERPPNSICISCIFWAEKGECYVTSVDVISLLEQLVMTTKFTVEEKNRIRRNLEGFHPLTVSKAKPESEEFFRVIMAYPNPRPRNIEKDVKVFLWKKLAPALKKIISKYSAAPPSATNPHHHITQSYHHTSGPPALLTPVSSTSPGLYGPQAPDTTNYHHHDSQTMASPRAAPASWGPYTTRQLSPSLKSNHSPQGGGIRIPSLPSYVHHYGMSSSGGRWDNNSNNNNNNTNSNGYGDASSTTPTYPGHHHHHHQQQHHSSHVYGAGAYGSHHRE